LSGGLVPSFFPRKRWKFPCVQLHVNRTLCRRFKPIVSFEDFERCDVVAVIILPVMDEGRFRIHMYGGFMNLLDRKHSRRKAKFVETMRNRSFVQVARCVSYLEKHADLKSVGYLSETNSPPREEGRLRHQENFGEAHLSAADGVVAHTDNWLVSDHPGRCRGHPSSHSTISAESFTPSPTALSFTTTTSAGKLSGC